MRKPRDRHPKFKLGDKVLYCGQTAEIVSEGWWDECDDFRYEVDFRFGRSDRRYKGLWILKETSLTKKEN